MRHLTYIRLLATIAGSRAATSLLMLACSWAKVAGLGLYTLDLRNPQRKKSQGFKSGLRAGQSLPWMGFLETTLFPNWLSKYLMFWRVTWQGAPS